MSKEMKKYCIIGKIIFDLVGATMFFAIPMAACALAGYITNLI